MADGRGGSGNDLRRLLLDAAREILEEPETSFDLRKIAERAGKSRTAPYLVFGKTEEGGGLAALRIAVAAEGFEDLVGGLGVALDAAPDAEAGLEAMAAAYLGFARNHARLFRLMFGPEVGREMRGRGERASLGRELRGRGERASEGGARVGGDPGRVARASHAPTHGNAGTERDPSAFPGRKIPARSEHQALRRAHRRLEEVLIEAIARQDPGYMRGDRQAGARTVAGALWALLHGVATLTIDEQWGLTGLADPEARRDPDELAERTLRFLTTASSEALRGAAGALERARAAHAMRLEEDALRTSLLPREAIDPADPAAGDTEEAGPRLDTLGTEEASADAEPPSPASSPWSLAALRESPGPNFAAFAARESGAAPYGRPRHRPRTSALRRARERMDLARGARILWIDDQPRSVAHEAAMLEGLGARVYHAPHTRGALTLLRKLGGSDLIVSDIERQGDRRAGIDALPRLAEASNGAPVVFYVRRHDPARPPPPGAFGITGDPDELLHLVFDVMERGRGADG